METKFSQIAHLYLRCKVHLENHTDGCTYSTLEGLDPFDGCTLLHWGDDDEVGYRTDEVSLETIKPILRHLSDITEEDREALSQILLTMDVNSYADAIMVDAAKTTYLLSKGYDLFNLIETGQAINAKTV